MTGNGGILIGIVTHNRKDLILRALAECRRLGFENVVVFDNGSTDGTRDVLHNRHDMSYLHSQNNEGCSGGFSRLMRFFAENTSCRWLLVFDDDAYPTFACQSLTEYLIAHAGDGYAGYALRVVFPDGTPCPMNKPGIDVLSRLPLQYLWRDFHIDVDGAGCAVDFASFSGLMLSRETILKVGIVSREFYIYSDDTYYTLSISRKVGQLYYCPHFTLIHDCNRSSRNLTNVDSTRIEREVVNKIVMIREFSKYKLLYILIYLVRLLFSNPKLIGRILSASRKGLGVDLALYRNEVI